MRSCFSKLSGRLGIYDLTRNSVKNSIRQFRGFRKIYSVDSEICRSEIERSSFHTNIPRPMNIPLRYLNQGFEAMTVRRMFEEDVLVPLAVWSHVRSNIYVFTFSSSSLVDCCVFSKKFLMGSSHLSESCSVKDLGDRRLVPNSIKWTIRSPNAWKSCCSFCVFAVCFTYLSI